jgi:hypothetical protein
VVAGPVVEGNRQVVGEVLEFGGHLCSSVVAVGL